MTYAKYEDLNNKSVLITGALGKLGKATCTAYADQGANLILLDKQTPDEHFLNLLRDRKVLAEYFQVNFEDPKGRDLVIKEISRRVDKLDILINNAAFVGTTDLEGWAVPFQSQSLATWSKAIEVNLTAPFHLIQGLESFLRKSENPAIVNLGSIYGTLGPDWELYKNTKMGNPAAYSVSKGGLIQLTKWLATTLGPHIRVNSVSPGGIQRLQDPNFIARYSKKTPLNRLATEGDVVSTILFLSSLSASYITGQNIMVDGGWSTW